MPASRDSDPRLLPPADGSDLPLFAGLAPAGPVAPAHTPYSDPDTSLEAAHFQSSTGKGLTDERRVWEALTASPDTDDGLEVRLGLRHQTCSARRRGLVLKGLVEWTGRYGETRSGRRAKLWGALPDTR